MAAFPSTIPVEPPTVNIPTIKVEYRYPEDREFRVIVPVIVYIQFISLVPVGKDIITVIPV
jgi:hypothetical protein